MVSERYAAPTSFSRPSNLGATASTASALTRSSSVSRSCLSAIVSAAPSGSRDRGLDGLEDVVAVVEEERELTGRLGGLLGEPLLRLAQHPDERLGGLEALGDDLLGRRRGATGDERDRADGGLGLDHHDRDVVTDDAAGDDHVERRPPRARCASGTRPTGHE